MKYPLKKIKERIKNILKEGIKNNEKVLKQRFAKCGVCFTGKHFDIEVEGVSLLVVLVFW